MTYRAAKEYIMNQLPMFQRIGSAAYKASLDTTIQLDNYFKNPHLSFRTIHVAGTNGKGSVSHFLASIFQEAGYKTGLFTSPHLKDYRERIKINGKKISRNYVRDFVTQHKTYFKKLRPSFFELSFALGMKYFKDKKVDIAIIETGMGGRLDSTNVIQPLLSIITNIGYDHQQFLGNTLAKIAQEKSGIIKSQVPVIISEYQKEIADVFKLSARKNNCRIFFADKSISIKTDPSFNVSNPFATFTFKGQKIKSGLVGSYQIKNVKAVLCAIDQLNNKEFRISKSAVINGFKNVVKNNSLLGRWQVLNKKPLCIAESAHNKNGMIELQKTIKEIPKNKLHFVIGFVNDKNINEILSLLPKKASYYYCAAKIPRALNLEELKNKAKPFGLSGLAYDSVLKAKNAALKHAKKDDLIIISGSIFVVAEAI